MNDTISVAPTVVAHLDDLPEGGMKMVKVDGHRVLLVRTSDGVHAIDHACPHEGYGLSQGSLDGDLLTCQWHNWKFRVSDGECVVGEEAVRVHDVEIADDGTSSVELDRPSPEELRPQLLASLRRGIEKDYTGQVARDVVRLLQNDGDPGEMIWQAVAHGAPRGEFGWGHSIASATDCLQMLDLYEGDQRALPIVQGISGVAEMMRNRPAQPLADPRRDGSVDLDTFRSAVEREDLTEAQSLVRGAIERGDDAAELHRWFTAAVSDHHLSYGHGAIYTQKAFELLDLLGWERADTVLPHLVTGVIYGTREDTLPYMRPFLRPLAAVDLDALADRAFEASGRSDGWRDDGRLSAALLGSDRAAPVQAIVDAIHEGASLDHVLDVIVDAVSIRMLRYDTDGEFDFHDDFGWLDITHGLTYANAVRFHLEGVGGDDRRRGDLVRMVMWCAFQANWTGRHEWHTGVGPVDEITPISTDVVEYGDALQRTSLLDGTPAFIVHAHAVKTSRAAALEARRRSSLLPLDAAARFLAAPKLERFVAATVERSIDFLSGRAARDA